MSFLCGFNTRRYDVNIHFKTALAAIALLAFLAGSVHATTVGFVGAASVNQDIPANYGSNILADGTGWTTTDGTGTTPNPRISINPVSASGACATSQCSSRASNT